MKLLENVEKIFIEKYQPFTIPDKSFKNIYKYIEANPEEKNNSDKYFAEKYKLNIPRGWYGFDIGCYLPESWKQILDETLELCIDNDSNFEIYQIKIKFGGVRFYVGAKLIEDIFEIEELIESKFYSKYLIY